MSENLTPKEIMSYMTEISAAYLTANNMSAEEIPTVLKRVFQTIVEISKDANNIKHRPALTPAIPIEESIHDDYIICLEDGKKLQMLKRHLNTVYNMTVEQYKERWGLPMDYPAVAPNYAKRRSDIARKTGLGSTGRKPSSSARAA